MNNKKVSVIVPIYGVEKYLREAVDSILNQTLEDLEIILIDDGGKDSCPQIIDEYASMDNRIVAIHKPNGGYGHTMNVGLEKATGEYIAILEPDDYINSKMYEDLYNIAKQYDSDIVKSGYYDNFETPTRNDIALVEWDNDKIPHNKSFTIKDCPLFLYYHPSVWTCLYKREFLNKNNIRFVEAPGAGWTDNPFQVQTMCLAERINYTPKAYYYWRRLNANDADDLKDYLLPFVRSDEIHYWLDSNLIDNENVLEALYAREFAYINIVFGMPIIKDLADCMRRIKLMCKRMDKNIVKKSELIPSRDKVMFTLALINPYIIYYFRKLAKYRKKYLSIRWNSKEKSVSFLGFKWDKGIR